MIKKVKTARLESELMINFLDDEDERDENEFKIERIIFFIAIFTQSEDVESTNLNDFLREFFNLSSIAIFISVCVCIIVYFLTILRICFNK